MPQLDFFSISNQFFWGIFYFILFYIIMEFYVVPTLFASIFAREYFIKNAGTDGNDNVYYAFFAFTVFTQLISEYNSVVVAMIDDLSSLDFNYYVTISESVNFEINNFDLSGVLFEDFDTK